LLSGKGKILFMEGEYGNGTVWNKRLFDAARGKRRFLTNQHSLLAKPNSVWDTEPGNLSPNPCREIGAGESCKPFSIN
jgi:hypothetical protein